MTAEAPTSGRANPGTASVAAEFHNDVLALGKLSDVVAPDPKALLALAPIASHAKWRSDVIEHDHGVGKGGGKVD
jgi:hypothetical protein